MIHYTIDNILSMFDNLSANQSGVARCFAASGESQVPLGRLLR